MPRTYRRIDDNLGSGRNSNAEGSVLIGLLVIMLAVAGLASVLLTRSSRSNAASVSSAEMSQLLFTAEAGLNVNYLEMEFDALYLVKDTLRFNWNPATKEFESATFSLQPGVTARQRSFKLFVQYFNEGTIVEFSDRTKPVEPVDEIVVRSEAGGARGRRTVTAWYEFHGYAIRRAITSDMIPTGPALGDNARATSRAGHVVFSGDPDHTRFHVHGDVQANGAVTFEGSDSTDRVELSDANVSEHLASSMGIFETNLAGTTTEIPDFTKIGQVAQLFDFGRYEAAAQAGAGAVYEGSAAFNTEMELANSMGRPLEGIQFVKIDPTQSNPDFNKEINIIGTLVIAFADGTDPFESLPITKSLNINAADLSAVNPADETTFTTGYPGVYSDPMKKPFSVDLSPAFRSFSPREDRPALMLNTGVLDIEGDANICGVIYSASCVEIRNHKSTRTQYLSGAVWAGGGIWFEADDSNWTVIRWDQNTVNDLDTLSLGGAGGTGGKELIRVGYAVKR